MLNLLVAFLLCFQEQQQEPQFPPIQGAINDFANILTEDDKTKLRNECAALRDSGGAAVVVCTTPSLYGLDVADYANQLFKRWGIGKKKEDNGVLILIAPNEKKARIEVGYGNESKLTDLEAKAILTDVVKPLFRAGKVSESVVAGTEAVLRKLGGTGAITPVTPILNKEPVPSGNSDWLILGLPALLVIPVGIILLLFLVYLISKLGGDFGGGGYSFGGGGGGGGGSSWGGSSRSSDSSSSGSSESSSSGGGDSGGGGASSDL